MFDPSPYLALWAASLQIAISDAQDPDPDAEQRVSAAWIWRDDTQPRSFLWVCDILGADPARIRKMCRIDNSVNLADNAHI